MPVPPVILKLVENFSTHIEHYKSSGYNETELRREYLDPFWKALGWDIDNEQGYADAYKDVIHEDAIKVGGYTKAPDYCFRIGGTRKFFLEAKKPAVSIRSDSGPAYQLRRYAWSAKLPLSVLSDFEELAVYDTRIRPNQSDKPSKARTFLCSYREYAGKWDEIAAIFSREAVLKGSFDKYADNSRKKRGTAEVDDAFLAEIERWRDLLARNFARRNPALSVRDLNYAVQKTIDRIIFLRICEDRGTEDYGRLNLLQNGSGVWPRLNEQFRRADDRYNSGLFHFKEEKGRNNAPDRLTPALTLDDKVLKDIIKHLYYPDSPYEFSVLPADILGQVYEQFLGKTIRLTSGHQAKIEEKPEVRKAGGVYYTPTYIVDYIVENTLGRLLNGDDPARKKPIAVAQAARLKLCDPACGSGSFLIVAYQYLLDWHRDQYTLDPATGEPDEAKIKRHAAGKNPKIYQAKGGEWKLTTPERKRILLNNIYGVDIDSQAVEVTKLSLLLKVLEGETQQQLQRDFISERQRILPDLGDNIQCGNSLIGPDFYENEQMQLLDDETKYRVNVFDWQSAFPQVFQQGGFDCVVGNPPYLGGREWKKSSPYEYEYYLSSFETPEYQFDMYVLFMEKAVRLLSRGGHAGYITPNTWLNNQSCEKLRKFLLENISLTSFVDYSNHKVFPEATVLPIIVTFQNKKQSEGKCRIFDPAQSICEPVEQVSQKSWELMLGSTINLQINDLEVVLIKNIQAKGRPLSESAQVKFGVKLYETGKGDPPQTADAAKGKVFEANSQLDSTYRRYLEGKDVFAYDVRFKNRWLKYGSNLAAPRKAELFNGPRLVFRRIVGDRLFGVLLREDFVTSQLLQIVKPNENEKKAPCFLLGVLNSRLLAFYFKKLYARTEKTFPEIRIYELAELPIRPIDFDNPDDVAKHDRMVALVERMLALHKQKSGETNPNTLKQLETQITATDRQIDRLVYELYALTDEEIQLIEESAAGRG
jgi:type I restriction-modification system DNA methylase subunit